VTTEAVVKSPVEHQETSTRLQFLDLGLQFEQIRNEVMQAVTNVLETQHFVLGLEVEQLEAEISDYLGCRFAVSCASGTDALMLALMATGSGEYAREMLRKPFVIGRHMYSNGMRVNSVAAANASGYLQHTLWLNQATSEHWARGEAMYRGQCGSCHTLNGYRSLDKLLAGRDRQSIGNLLDRLHEYKPDMAYRRFMPPLTGTPEEINALILRMLDKDFWNRPDASEQWSPA